MNNRSRNKRFVTSVTALFALALVAMMSLSPAQAAKLAGVTMADTVTLDGKTLVLNGLGVRAATFMKVKVYIIGLYLENKSSDAKAIIASERSSCDDPSSRTSCVARERDRITVSWL